jgi:N-acetylmuramoyl-L-alanine amidase/FG-GAP-like repeat
MMNHRQTDTFSEPQQASSRGLLARRGRVAAMASVLAAVPMFTGFPQVFSQVFSPASPHPVSSHVRHVGFVKLSVPALRTATDATSSAAPTPGAPDPIITARAAAVTPAQDVAGAVTVVGVTWPKGGLSAGSQFQIRTLSGTTWTQWQPLSVVDGGRDGTQATAGTDPYAVTGASKYEVRSLTTGANVPTATVQVVDPGTSSADNIQQAPGAASAATVKPAIYTRAQWGASPSLMKWNPSYGKISVGFVHHTDTSNNYTAAQVPGIIRGIYAYHAQTLGWGDIGYNFLVDRFGRIWEGRYGGMDKPVIGGQVYNYNTVSTGVSGIGTFASATVPQAMTDAFKRVLAWKLSLAGIPASGTSPIAAPWGTHIQRISGHRDVGGTTCPGNSLEAKLPEIRAGAAALMKVQPPPVSTPPPVTGLHSDFTGDGKPDVFGVTPSGDMYLYRGNSLGGFAAGGTKIGAGWSVFAQVFSPGDFTGDGKADIIGITSSGDMYLYRGNGAGGFAAGGTKIGAGWNMFAKVFSPGDFTGDAKTDILGITPSGDMYLYRGNGAGGFTSAVKIGAGWNMFAKVFSPGDFTGDRKADIIGITSSGDMYLYRGNGAGGFTAGGTKVGTGWNMFAKVFSPGDFTGDAKTDIIGIMSNGGLYLYRGSGVGGFAAGGTKNGTGWNMFTQVF